jgi:hypothetical protein
MLYKQEYPFIARDVIDIPVSITIYCTEVRTRYNMHIKGFNFTHGPGVDSTSNINEYQESSWG